MTHDAAYLVLQPQKKTPTSAGETGLVSIRDGVFYRQDGSIFPWRGMSSFRLFEYFCYDIDLTPVLQEALALGVNNLRVFGMYSPWIGEFWPQKTPNYYDKLRAFKQYMRQLGFRFEFTAFADAQVVMPDLREQESHLESCFQALANPDDEPFTTFLEVCNEPWQNMPGDPQSTFDRCADLAEMIRGRSPDVLVANGVYPNPYNEWAIPEVADYMTVHSERKYEWPRVPKELHDITDATGKPAVEDEGTGAADENKPDSRSNIPSDFAYYAGTAMLMGAGATFHSDCGVQSQVLTPTQRSCADAFLWALQWIPAQAQMWPYGRGTQEGGCLWVGESICEHYDSSELRTFGKPSGTGLAYAIQIRTVRTNATPCGSWRVVEEPRQGFVKVSV